MKITRKAKGIISTAVALFLVFSVFPAIASPNTDKKPTNTIVVSTHTQV